MVFSLECFYSKHLRDFYVNYTSHIGVNPHKLHPLALKQDAAFIFLT